MSTDLGLFTAERSNVFNFDFFYDMYRFESVYHCLNTKVNRFYLENVRSLYNILDMRVNEARQPKTRRKCFGNTEKGAFFRNELPT